jgi:hypothetical protein
VWLDTFTGLECTVKAITDGAFPKYVMRPRVRHRVETLHVLIDKFHSRFRYVREGTPRADRARVSVTERQRLALERLAKHGGQSHDTQLYLAGADDRTLNSLQKRGLIGCAHRTWSLTDAGRVFYEQHVIGSGEPKPCGAK